MHLEAEVEAARAECQAWSAFPSFSVCFTVLHFGANFVEVFRANIAVPETPISITQRLSALRLEQAHLLEGHGADRTALCQCEAELAEVLAREVEMQATANTSSRLLVPRRDARQGPSALLRLPSGISALDVC